MELVVKTLTILILINFVASFLIETDYEQLPMGAHPNIKVKVKLEKSEEDQWPENHVVKLNFSLIDKSSWAVSLLNTTLKFSYQDMEFSVEKPLAINAVIIGTNQLNITASTIDENDKEIPREESKVIDLEVVVGDRTLQNLFTIIMTIMVTINSVNMGGQLDLQVIKEVFKKPIGPVVGLVSQFLFMPLLSYGIGYLLFDNKLYRLGLFVLGCCPGGTNSNFWCLLLGADINLSITMTFVSTLAALGMMPFWLFVLGSTLSDENLTIPYSQLIFTLLGLIGPIALGMWIRWRFQKGAKIMKAIIIPFTLLIILFVFTAGIYINLFIFKLLTWQLIAGGFLCYFGGYIFGGLFAWLCRLKPAQIGAVSIETAFQNGGIAFVLLKISFKPPYGDLAAVPPVAQLMFTGVPLLIILIGLKSYQRWCKKPKIESVELLYETDFKFEKTPETKELLERIPSLPTSNV